ncbi:MAG: metal-transporting ATPase, partial [Lachnospiraceae bacterium]|nr:metal-transporting ATPase [Lachnospiraceae bacterium]
TEIRLDELSNLGKTPLLFAEGGRFKGIIAVSDTIREDSRKAIEELKNMGIYVVMLTGDNQRTAEAIGKEAGVNEVVAGVLPQGKEAVITELKNFGRTAMIGDGINDAPALTRADIGIAIGAGTDVAIDAADVVLMKDSLSGVPAAVRLSRSTYRNIKENLFWALIYNVLLIPTAAGVYSRLFGITMNPMLGALAMSLSSFCVVSNALRLNLVKIYDSSRDRQKTVFADPEEQAEGSGIRLFKNKKKRKALSETDIIELRKKLQIKENEKMTEKTMKIEGMMCGHCEATVKKALEALDGVSEAKVSHEEGSAIVTLTGEVTDNALKQAVEDKDYKVLSIA